MQKGPFPRGGDSNKDTRVGKGESSQEKKESWGQMQRLNASACVAFRNTLVLNLSNHYLAFVTELSLLVITPASSGCLVTGCKFIDI